MMVLVSYDVNTTDDNGKKRLRKVAKTCVNYGQRVQNSVFELNLDYGNFLKVKDQLLKIINQEKDSLRFYYLGNRWHNKIEHFGAKAGYDSEGLLMI